MGQPLALPQHALLPISQQDVLGGNGNDGDILTPHQFETRMMQHHCSWGETETTETEAMGGRERGGRREGGAATTAALSGDSIQYWETSGTSTHCVAVRRTNVKTGPCVFQRYWTRNCHKNWGGHAAGSSDPWAAAIGVIVWGLAA